MIGVRAGVGPLPPLAFAGRGTVAIGVLALADFAEMHLDHFGGSPIALGPDHAVTGEFLKVRRSFIDSDDLLDGMSKGEEKSRKKPLPIAGVGQSEWVKKVKQRGVPQWRALLVDDGDDDEAPLTIIGGKPIPVEVLQRHATGTLAQDPSSFVNADLLPIQWAGVGRTTLEGASFRQMPEPSAVGMLALSAAALLLRRRRRGR
jgi:hypothetical protein